ncbi:hypothetical protein TNCV_886631 [Trichonephila clavipes]|uniref:Uncharacterized protein n=1 Tax=Trichonephila clavipes TaxID=2585209 RepID=A0A8X6R9F5_TRICX|nr:hypothetical protein TNCV_886631 [Trichonephila clavipes]
MPRTREGEPPLAQPASDKFNLLELIPTLKAVNRSESVAFLVKLMMLQSWANGSTLKKRTIRGRNQVSRPSRIQPVNQRRVSFTELAADNYYPTPRSIQGRYPSVLQGNSSERTFNFQGSQNAGALRQNRDSEDLNFRGERRF